MAKQTDFTTGTIVTADFLDSQQEVDSALAWGVVLEKASSQVVRCKVAADGSGAGQTSIIINGLPRLITSAVTFTFPGTGMSSATYNVYAVAGAGPAFTITAAASPPGGDSRKIGEVDWDDSANNITAVRSMVDAVAGHNGLHLPGKADALPTATATSVTDATTNTEGSALSFARSDHTHNLDLSAGLTVGGTAGLVVSGSGGKDTLSISNATLNTGLQIGGDALANIYRSASGTLRMDGALVIGGSGLWVISDTATATLTVSGVATLGASSTVGGSVIVTAATALGGDLTGTVGGAQIAAGVVGPTELATDAVTTAKIDDEAVTYAEIATPNLTTVTSSAFGDGSITLGTPAQTLTTNAPSAGFYLIVIHAEAFNTFHLASAGARLTSTLKIGGATNQNLHRDWRVSSRDAADPDLYANFTHVIPAALSNGQSVSHEFTDNGSSHTQVASGGVRLYLVRIAA